MKDVTHKRIVLLATLLQKKMIMILMLLTLSFDLVMAKVEQHGEQTELIQAIMESNNYTESLLKNVMFKVRFEEDIEPGFISEDQLYPIHHVKKLKYLYEPEGRIRIEEQILELENPNVPYVDILLKTQRTWVDNLREDMALDARPGFRSLSIRKRLSMVHRLRKPTFFSRLGANSLSKLIQDALDQGLPIRVSREQDGPSPHIMLRVPRKINDSLYEYVCWLDEQKMYYPFKIEAYRDGKLIHTKRSTPQQVQDDIWMPLKGIYESFNSKGERHGRLVMEVEEIKVNMPELADSLFDIEILPGTRVADNRGGDNLVYIVGADDVADMMLEDLAIIAQNDKYVSDRRDSTRVKPPASDTEQVSDVNVPERAAVSTNNRQPNPKRGSPTPQDSGNIGSYTYLLCVIVSILIVSIVLIGVLKRKSIVS